MVRRLATVDTDDGELRPAFKVPDSSLPDRLKEAGLAATVAAEVEAQAIPVTADAGDTKAVVTKRLEMVDTAGAKGSQINFEHFANGTGKTGVGAGQTYAVDIHNNPGAKSALVIHQYSNETPAVRLDNTGTGAMLLIAQTNNPLRNPESLVNTAATGDAIRVVDHTGAYWMRVMGRGEVVLTPPADATTHALDITTAAASTRNAIRINHNSATPAINIVAAAGSTGQYPVLISGQTHGAQFSTSQAGGFVLGLTRNSTGSGDVLNLRNDGTGRSVLYRQGTTEVAQIRANGEYEHLTAGAGIYLKSPDGTRYKITVANGGAISAVAG